MADEINIYKLDDFTDGYIECMLWSSTDNADESGGQPLDENYAVSDIAQESLRKIVEDCKDFQEANAELLEAAYETGNYDASHAGHDFWLTRNGHGAGFWDRGLEQGDALTKAAKTYGGIDPYVVIGSDGEGKVYL